MIKAVTQMLNVAIRGMPNDHIGHPKLFMTGEEAERNRSPQPVVNNCVAAKKFAARFGWF
jgi:hypothetical protein